MLDRYLLYMTFRDKDKPLKRVCSPEGDKKNCGKEMTKIPYRRREADAQALNVFVCPDCDALSAWPRNK